MKNESKIGSTLFTIATLSLILGAGCGQTQPSRTPSQSAPSVNTQVENATNTTHQPQTDVKPEETKSTGTYETYESSKLTLAENNNVILFFHASWCPTCRAVEKDINTNLSLIPQGVHILKLDYQKENELKKKYSVTYQHTFVQVDKDGNMIKKWSGGNTLDSILSQVQ